MLFHTLMRKFKFEYKGTYYSRLEEEDLYEVIKVENKYVVRRETSCRGDVRVNVVICNSLGELVPMLRDMLEYYDRSEYVQTYSIINTTTKHILTIQTSLEEIKRYWNNIPRRKTTELVLVDDATGEILKVKPPRERC